MEMPEDTATSTTDSKQSLENKYFTPSIEDIRVGYECERILPSGKWYFDIIEESQLTSSDEPFKVIIADIATGGLRVPYLTKEQIEKEGGWKVDSAYSLRKEDYIIECKLDDISSENCHIFMNEYQLFCGKIKDINTFRYIIKILEIL